MTELAKKILIVDDDESILTYISTFLEDNGFRTVCAEDGNVGLKKAVEEKPDLICLDITMPEESGVGMYRKLKNDENLKNIPVFIVTGVSVEFKRFIESRRQVPPPTAYFEKPIDRDEFLAKVKEVLGA